MDESSRNVKRKREDEEGERIDHQARLVKAVQAGDLSRVKELVENGNVNVYYADYENQHDAESPVEMSYRLLHWDIVRLMIENSPKRDGDKDYINCCKEPSGRTHLHRACYDFSLELVELLIKNGANVDIPDNNGLTPLDEACTYDGWLGVVRLIIEYGARVSDRTMHVLCARNSLELAELVIPNGDVDAQNDNEATPLHVACENGNVEMARLLIENGANLHAEGKERYVPLTIAIKNGHLDVIKLLNEYSADVYYEEDYGTTPLHIACLEVQMEIVEYLITNGADVTAKDNGGRSTIHSACDGGNLEIIKFLMEKGVDTINSKDNDGKTPLHLACFGPHGVGTENIEFLIESGADVDAQDNGGMTPLLMACRYCPLDYIQLLLSRGANATMKTVEGTSALEMASERNDKEVIWFLVRQFPWLVTK